MPTSAKIHSIASLLPLLARWRAAGERIVFTNGCFDLLHLGHVDYLEQARAFGDRLVVGLNSDSSVSRLKGPSRPVNDEYARARILAALAFTDAITVFAEETPYALIQQVQPDVLVKGNDYRAEDIVGYDVVMARGGRVETIPMVAGYSTTGTIAKLHG